MGPVFPIHQENTELLRRLKEATEKLAENQQHSDDTTPSTEHGLETSRAASDAYSPAAEGRDAAVGRGEIAKLLQTHQQAEALREDSRQNRMSLEDHKKKE